MASLPNVPFEAKPSADALVFAALAAMGKLYSLPVGHHRSAHFGNFGGKPIKPERSATGMLQLDYPDELLQIADRTELEHLAREALLVRLYDLGKVSSGRAARILGVSRRQFLDTLGQYGVSVFDESIDFDAESRRG